MMKGFSGRAGFAVLGLALVFAAEGCNSSDGGNAGDSTGSGTGGVSTGNGGGGSGPTRQNPKPTPTTSPTATPTASPTGGTDPGPTGSAALDSEEWAFVSLINDYRVQNGLPKLEVSVALTKASDWMSVDMAAKNYFSHTDSQGRSPFDRMKAFGYTQSTYSGENIAAGNAGAQATFNQWKNSPGHNANMLGASYRAIGVARAQGASSSYGWYWTTGFGSYVDSAVK